MEPLLRDLMKRAGVELPDPPVGPPYQKRPASLIERLVEAYANDGVFRSKWDRMMKQSGVSPERES